jgi:hypothetical protein
MKVVISRADVKDGALDEIASFGGDSWVQKLTYQNTYYTKKVLGNKKPRSERSSYMSEQLHNQLHI